MTHGDTYGLDSRLETVTGRTCGEHGYGRVGVAPVDSLIEVRLLRLRRQAGRRTAALGIDDDERQLSVDREPDCLGLKRDTRARARGHTDGAGIRRADCRANRCDLIFGLKHTHTELPELREAVQQRRSRRDRIGTEHQRPVRQLPGSGKP
jgi:hypothetical protein